MPFDHRAEIIQITAMVVVVSLFGLGLPLPPLKQQAIGGAREALLDLRDAGRIGDEVRREAERYLDLEELKSAG